MIPSKVLIYATSAQGILAFSEPDYPDVPLQVPGGTLISGESALEGARREFFEETGLISASAFEHLVTHDSSFDHAGKTYRHRRSYFHTHLEEDLPASWDHYETHASGGGAPILFRFIWLEIPAAKAQLGLEMGEFVHLIRTMASR